MQRDPAHIREDHPAMGIQADKRHVLTEPVKQRVQRHQRQHRREHLENQHPFQQGRFPREAHTGKSVGAGGGEGDDTDRGNASDLNRVPQPQQHRERRRRDAAIGVFDAKAQREAPVLPRNIFRN